MHRSASRTTFNLTHSSIPDRVSYLLLFASTLVLTFESLPTVTPYRLPFSCHEPFPTRTQLALVLVLCTNPKSDLVPETPVRLPATFCRTLPKQLTLSRPSTFFTGLTLVRTFNLPDTRTFL